MIGNPKVSFSSEAENGDLLLLEWSRIEQIANTLQVAVAYTEDPKSPLLTSDNIVTSFAQGRSFRPI